MVTQRRSLTRELAGNERALAALADRHAGPAELAEERDLLDNALHRLHRKERELAVGWAEGVSSSTEAGPPDAVHSELDEPGERS